MKDESIVWLKGSGHGGEGKSYLFTEPMEVLRAEHIDDVLSVLGAVDAALYRGHWVAGYMSYEAGYAFEPGLFGSESDRFARSPDTIGQAPGSSGSEIRGQGVPLAWFGVFGAPVEGSSPPGIAGPAGSDSASVQSVTEAPTHPAPRITSVGRFTSAPRFTSAGRSISLLPDESPEAFMDGVRRIREWIRTGDLYQVNLTARFTGRTTVPGAELFLDLLGGQPADYASYIRADGVDLLSFSPELFFRRNGSAITTRPMKGTASRGATPEEDAGRAAWLQADPKSRAENLMIVDLLRNDLSIVCEPGSVRVPALFEVETYPSLFQMTSTVTGRLRPGVGYLDLMRALFPSGSVTGAPKKRAMQRILELETTPRGPYCGTIGFASPDGRAVFSVAIRTAVLHEERFLYGAGGGIVWDSDPEAEWQEAVLKSRFLTHPPARPGFQLIETMKCENGHIPLIRAHLDRLESSSRDLGWNVDCAEVESKLVSAIRKVGASSRVRLLVDQDGTCTVAVVPPEGPRPSVWKVGLSNEVVLASDPMLRHKSTRREVHDRARKEAIRRGLDEVLLTNERGHVTEGSITNIFIRKGEQWLTPRVESGLLPGIGRAVFMKEHPSTLEQELTPEDMARADEIVLTNAVIGQVRALWIP